MRLPVLILVCGFLTTATAFQKEGEIVTVKGSIAPAELGKTLVHEHIFTNFNGTETANHPIGSREEAIKEVLPKLSRLFQMGYTTLVECTPSYIGKDVAMLKELSEKSGLQIITNTGYYAAVDKKFLPEHAYSNSAEELAAAWEEEWKHGINGGGIRPGFIKLGVGKGQLDEMERKIVKAGMLLSMRSGLTVYVHTGGDESILSQYQLASEMNFDLSKLVWVHAQNGTDSTRMAMAARGMWVSLDGVNEKGLENYIQMISKFRDAGLLHRLLISHDDGWSVEPGEEFTLFNNGNSSPYQTIETQLLPGLTALGFSSEDINTLLIANPAKVLAITN